MNASEPMCLRGPCNNDDMNEVLVANSTLIEDLLKCFLVDPNCTMFQSVLTRQLAMDNLYQSMPATHIYMYFMHMLYTLIILYMYMYMYM